MRLTSSGAYARPPPVPKMPAGLVELMEDLTRNVLRHNPANVYEFCAGHMEKLLEMRDGPASKQVLTLEQKIARVQEKMNKRADLRRQKYDMQMKLYRSNSKLEQTSEQQNSKLEKTSEEQDVQMGTLKVVENKYANSSETHSIQDDTRTKQTITSVLEKNRTPQSNIAENQSKDPKETSLDQELDNKNNADEFLPMNDTEIIETKESVKIDLGQDKNILVETNDSVDQLEQHQENDSEIQNEAEESLTVNRVEVKGGPDEVEKIKDFIEITTEQDVHMSNEQEEQAPVMLVENKNTSSRNVKDEPLKSMENKSDEDVVIQAEVDAAVFVKVVKDEICHLDVAEDSKDSIEIPLQEVIETKNIKDEFIGAPDQKAFSSAEEEESKPPIPVHHEQDLVDDLEVEIFHEPIEEKKGTKELTDNHEFNERDESSYTQNLKTDMENETTKDKNNEEGQYSVNDSSSLDQYYLPSTQKEGENTESSTDLKSRNTDFLLEVSSLDYTNTNVKNSAIEICNNTSNFNETPETPVESHENISDVESKVYELSECKSNDGISEVSVVDNQGKIMIQEMSPPATTTTTLVRVTDYNESITNNIPPEENDAKEDVLDMKVKTHVENGTLEIPMQKKNYALLLPQIKADNETESVMLKNEINDETLYSEIKENVDNTTDENTSKDENIVTNVEDSAGVVETDKAQTTDINKEIYSSVDVHAIKTRDELQEKNKDDVDVGNIEQQNLNSHIEFNAEIKNETKEEEFDKLSNDKQNEIVTLNNDIKTELETAKLEERFDSAEENILSNSQHTQETETVVNDSADDSTVGDSNDSLMDNDVEIRSKETNRNPNTMDLETAAVTIQKVFRTFLFKSRCSTFEDTSTDEANPVTDDDNEKEELEYSIIKERRALGISRMDTVLQTVNEEKSLSLSTDDSSTLSSAATVIQAHVRGFLARNKFESHKTTSDTSLINSDELSTQAFDADEKQKKTVLNIHIVPEGDHFLSRDESLITSMDLSLDGTPPSSVNLHPLGYDKSEPRKQLKREDAIQSISPPTNNSGKLSEDVDSIKEMVINDNADPNNVSHADTEMDTNSSPTKSNTFETVIETTKDVEEMSAPLEPEIGEQRAELQCKRILTKMSSDEGDVITPFQQDRQSDRTSHLLHSGEFHDIVLPTTVTRSDTSVVRGE